MESHRARRCRHPTKNRMWCLDLKNEVSFVVVFVAVDVPSRGIDSAGEEVGCR